MQYADTRANRFEGMDSLAQRGLFTEDRHGLGMITNLQGMQYLKCHGNLHCTLWRVDVEAVAAPIEQAVEHGAVAHVVAINSNSA